MIYKHRIVPRANRLDNQTRDLDAEWNGNGQVEQ